MKVLYNFDQRHAAAVASGAKRRTIRRDRRMRRHAEPGDTVVLYAGLRTKKARILRTAICFRSRPVSLLLERGVLVGAEVGRRSIKDLDGFARKDGFDDAAAMGRFFEKVHGGSFCGRMIEWA